MTDTTLLIAVNGSTIVVNAIVVYGFLSRFATVSDLRKVEKDARDRTDAVEQRLSNNLTGLEQRLTRDIHDNRSGNEHRFGELGAKVDGLNGSVQLFTNEMNRVVGALEGKHELVEKLMSRISSHV